MRPHDADDVGRPQSPRTTDRLVDSVYRRLRWEILTGVVSPHQHLVEGDVASRFGVSRTPVRESMQRLAADGLVVSERRRWVVYAHTRQEVRNFYEIRMALEGFAARLACERASVQQIETMDRVLTERPPDDSIGLEDFISFNGRFHGAVLRGSNNEDLTTMVERNLAFAFSVRLAMTYSAADIRDVNIDHGRMVSAIRARDADLAEQRTRQHVSTSLAVAMERLLVP